MRCEGICRVSPGLILGASLLAGWGLTHGAAEASGGVVVASGIDLDASRDLVFAPFDNAVSIIDVSDPAAPSLVSDAIVPGGETQDLHYDGNTERLFIAADDSGLEIWDVSSPQAPSQISVTELLYFDVPVPARSVDVVGDVAYVSAGYGYLHWLDVSDPGAPDDFGFNGQGGNPSREVVADGNGNVFLSGPHLLEYTIEPDGSLDSASMHPYGSTFELDVAGGYAYASSGVGPLAVFDAQAPGLPVIGDFETDNIKDIDATGGFVYLATIDGLRILDVSTPSEPVQIANESSASASDVAVQSGYAYARTGIDMRIIDVSEPTDPVVVGAFVPCRTGGDINGDGAVDSADLNIVLSDFGCTGGCDGDADGDTDADDLNAVLGAFGDAAG